MPRPSKGTVTRRVWEIADEISAKRKSVAPRSEVIDAAVSEGINANTANTQYGHWKRATHPGLSGSRQVSPRAKAMPEDEGFQDWSRLLKSGFVYVADFFLSDDGQPVLDAEVPDRAGVYAFVDDQAVVYVGVTLRTLRKRMGDYRRGHLQQKTSSRLHSELRHALQQGRRIRLLCAVPDDSTWNGLPVVTALGLEEGLIREFHPVWNIKGA